MISNPETDAPQPEAWQRQEKESPEAFEAFAIYRDLGTGERSHVKVAHEVGKNPGLISRWSKTHRWIDRVAAFDAHLDREHLDRMSAKRIELEDEMHRTGLRALAAFNQWLDTFKPNNDVKPTDAARIGEFGLKLASLAVGERPESEDVPETIEVHRTLEDLLESVPGSPAALASV